MDPEIHRVRHFFFFFFFCLFAPFFLPFSLLGLKIVSRFHGFFGTQFLGTVV